MPKPITTPLSQLSEEDSDLKKLRRIKTCRKIGSSIAKYFKELYNKLPKQHSELPSKTPETMNDKSQKRVKDPPYHKKRCCCENKLRKVSQLLKPRAILDWLAKQQDEEIDGTRVGSTLQLHGKEFMRDEITGITMLIFFIRAPVRECDCLTQKLSKQTEFSNRSSFKSKDCSKFKKEVKFASNIELCGPMRVCKPKWEEIYSGNCEDYSRYTWTLFLRSKDETPDVLKDFLTMIQRNLQAPIISVRTDRGTEFLNKTLHAVFKEEGIEHQTSTPRTPKQNGVVER
ncbi:retrovirus-related pol polyprotein from transposon TNT 1-94 [Tanacetum coccineum]